MKVICWTVARRVPLAAHHIARHTGKAVRLGLRHGPLQMSHHGARAAWRTSVVCALLVPPAILVPPLVYPPVSYPPLSVDFVPPGAPAYPVSTPHPVPEPGTAAVLAGAVVALAALRRRQSHISGIAGSSGAGSSENVVVGASHFSFATQLAASARFLRQCTSARPCEASRRFQ